MSMRLRAETEWAISAAKVVLCMRRRSTSLTENFVSSDPGGADWCSRTVVDDESLVAGGHQVTGLLVGSVTDLCRTRQSMPISQSSPPQQCSIRRCRPVVHRVVRAVRTLGIAAWPLNRLRTRLSIPLGLRHEGSTPVPSQHPSLCSQFLGYRTHEAVGLVAVEALGVCIGCVSLRNLRFGCVGSAYAS